MFQGFSKETVDFMWGIRFNNERSWFEAHKDEYKTCLETPMKELCKYLASLEVVDAKLDGEGVHHGKAPGQDGQ